MKTMKLMNILMAVLLSVMVFALPVFADGEITNTGTLLVPTEDGETDVTAPYVSVTGAYEPGVLMTAAGQSVSATIEGNVDAVYGGADMEASGGGQAVLNAKGIRGRFGVLAYINDGQITGTVDSITASGDTAIEAVLGRSGSFQFTANSISSTANAVTLETGVDFSDHIVDSGIYDDPGDPGDDDWDVIDDEDLGETEASGESDPDGKNLPVNLFPNNSVMDGKSLLSGSGTAKADGGAGDVVITSGSIDAGVTAVDVWLNDASTVSLTADDITSEGTAVRIGMSEEGGNVTLTVPFIDAYEQGIRIEALNGKVTVNNEDFLSGKSGIEVFNGGADISLEAGFIYASSGLFVESTSGTTVENTEDIAADNYGIYVRTYDAMEEQPFEPDSDPSEQGSAGNSAGAPSVKITVDGDIADDFKFPEETGEDYILPPDETEGKWIAKDGEEEEEEEEDAEVSTGIIVAAETEGTVEINVLGEVYMAYGNEIDADNGAEVNVSIRDDVTTTYGNRLASDNAKVTFSVGENINAGGYALDTLASGDGELNVTVGKDILVNDSGYDEETTGIYANSMENGVTKIEVKGGISVVDESGETPAYGVFAENTGGDITITVGDDVIADGEFSFGALIVNGSDSDFSETGTDNETDVKTVVEIMGDLTGESTGLYVDGTESTLAEVFVEGIITGDDAGVEVSDEVTPENLDLKVWKIALKSGKAVIGGTNAEEVEKHINYLIRYEPDDLKNRLVVVDENGALLPSVHGYQYAKDGVKIYFRSDAGDIPALYNGRNALTKESDGRFSLIIPTGGGILISTSSAPAPVDPPHHGDDLFWLYDCELPGTGFSSRHVTPLAVRPQDLNYRKTGLTLQIPGLDVEEEIVKVPETDGSYHIEWLDSSIGLLEHSSLPGKGITVLTGHNHLNSTEAGPFLFIGKMDAGDRIMITDAGNNTRFYKVYGNYKVASNGFASIADELRENALVLITCEDESPEGGYINRRIVLAEPLGL